MQDQGKSAYITTSTTTVLNAYPGGGVLRTVACGAPGTTWVADFYDNIAGSGTLLFSWTITAAGSMDLFLQYSQGLTCVTSGGAPGKLTVVYT